MPNSSALQLRGPNGLITKILNQPGYLDLYREYQREEVKNNRHRSILRINRAVERKVFKQFVESYFQTQDRLQ